MLPKNLSESEVIKIIGLTVDIKISNLDEIITGLVYTLMKSNNMLILLRKDENDQINSFIINIEHLSEIKLSKTKIQVWD